MGRDGRKVRVDRREIDSVGGVVFRRPIRFLVPIGEAAGPRSVRLTDQDWRRLTQQLLRWPAGRPGGSLSVGRVDKHGSSLESTFFLLHVH